MSAAQFTCPKCHCEYESRDGQPMERVWTADTGARCLNCIALAEGREQWLRTEIADIIKLHGTTGQAYSEALATWERNEDGLMEMETERSRSPSHYDRMEAEYQRETARIQAGEY